jgi:Restriction endonuclease XhoI
MRYAQRYEILCERLVHERLYDATCLLMSSEKGGLE